MNRVLPLAPVVGLLGLLMLAALIPAAAQEANGCFAPLDLVPGQEAYTRPGIFVRNLPSLSGGQVGYYNTSVTFTVVGGPVCADGYNWWQVETPGNPGWVAEGKPDFVLLFPGPRPGPGPACPAPLSIAPGTLLQLNQGSRLRAEPGLRASTTTVLPFGGLVYTRGEVVCADGINWWPVTAEIPLTGEILDGWIAEGQDGHLLISIPEAPSADGSLCAPPARRLSVGVRAVISYTGTERKNLRTEPGTDAPILTTVLDGLAVDILEGPVCADGLNWWKIQVVTEESVVGWMAEGGTAAGGYWLRPLDLR